MRAEDEVTDTLRRAHRAASARLDEAPDAGVRAAVLAAAARGVDARPLRVTTTSRWRGSRRWPLSAAALLLVSVMTGLVATRVMRDHAEGHTLVASVAPPERNASPGNAEGSTPSAEQTAPAPSTSTAAVVASKPSQPNRSLKRSEARARDAQPSADPYTAPASTPAVPVPSAAASVAPPPAAAPSPPVQEALARAGPSIDKAAVAGNEVTDAAAPPRTARARIGRAVEPATPEAWVDRIVRLRVDGNDLEAEREVDALRQRYPGFVIPAIALKATGTR